ncbi:uncharacterized protein SPSK_05605 [Sporothrix schenckii 1099-18]|uniref:Uncharacterized protein n=1 Tax=Sporothrix schenckii 1099-18 TaxID=1397361 RepID=A0A0F2LU02_SPOSC|nr:uncharacterized protein SPSK_05605 [Sporothrix schenckii 1099-18]KJR80943.1 hypothetical protein SPSK_05605 [Sporothrix schenckii 1099-18]
MVAPQSTLGQGRNCYFLAVRPSAALWRSAAWGFGAFLDACREYDQPTAARGFSLIGSTLRAGRLRVGTHPQRQTPGLAPVPSALLAEDKATNGIMAAAHTNGCADEVHRLFLISVLARVLKGNDKSQREEKDEEGEEERIQMKVQTDSPRCHEPAGNCPPSTTRNQLVLACEYERWRRSLLRPPSLL